MLIQNLIRDYETLLKYNEIIINLDSPTPKGELKISFKFLKSEFKHLLGFHYTYFEKLSSQHIYNLCTKGNIQLTEENLQLLNKQLKLKTVTGKGTNKLIKKIRNFNFINKLIHTPSHQPLIKFDKTLVIGTTEQGSEYILHLENEDTRYHLGLKYSLEYKRYVPCSFFIEENDKKDKFLTHQQLIKINKIQRILK